MVPAEPPEIRIFQETVVLEQVHSHTIGTTVRFCNTAGSSNSSGSGNVTEKLSTENRWTVAFVQSHW